MNRISMVGLAVVGLALGGGCVDADASLLLTGPVAFGASINESETGTTGSCTINTETSLFWSRLQINLEEIRTSGQIIGRAAVRNATNQFDMSVLLENRLVPSDNYSPIGEGQNLRVDQNLIQVERVSFAFPPGSNQPGFGALDKEFDFVVTVDSGGGTAATFVPIISAADIQRWETVVGQATMGNNNAVVPGAVDIQVFGRTTSGTEIESNLVTVPFDVCAGCPMISTPRCVEE